MALATELATIKTAVQAILADGSLTQKRRHRVIFKLGQDLKAVGKLGLENPRPKAAIDAEQAAVLADVTNPAQGDN